MLFVVNPSAGGGSARSRWTEEEGRLPRRIGAYSVLCLDSPEATVAGIRTALEAGETEFVAAGGDGTVNLLLATVLSSRRFAGRVRIGALGLGSSNDFHKPNRGARAGASGAPRRIDFGRARPVDVGELVWTGADGRAGRRPWLLNASVGITAEANRYFNRSDGPFGLLKRHVGGLAIAWAALRTLLLSRPLEATVTVDGVAMRERLCNLAIVKSPHVSGGLRYDSPLEPDSGRFHVHGIRAVGRIRLLRILAGLARGRFRGTPGTFSTVARQVTVEADRPFRVECDGEVFSAVRARIRLRPHAVKVCP